MGRPTNSTCTRRQDTASSTTTDRGTGKNRPWMAGTRCSHSSRNISELLVEHGKTFLVRLMEVKPMCTGIVENTKVSGSGRGPEGWFPLEQASVSYDHPDH